MTHEPLFITEHNITRDNHPELEPIRQEIIAALPETVAKAGIPNVGVGVTLLICVLEIARNNLTAEIERCKGWEQAAGVLGGVAEANRVQLIAYQSALARASNHYPDAVQWIEEVKVGLVKECA